jgi:hypothetical protein
MMSNVAEIASAAKTISLEKLVIAKQEAEMSVLKMNIDTQAQLQLEMIEMLRQLQPYLGSNVNTTA